ncbi:MAG: hypothetical protein LBG64_02980 [Pseudomonadales bacterium]|jgi:hypothetical protein|nr:hypothetical protein [Pseudomonadales bacterium]
MKKIWNWKILILTIPLALTICFLAGAFMGTPIRLIFPNDNSCFINRGIPIAYAGVCNPSLTIDFPIVRAPFIILDVLGDTYYKIIDLSVLMPMFLVMLIPTYVTILYLKKKLEINNNKNFALLIISSIILCILSYFLALHAN